MWLMTPAPPRRPLSLARLRREAMARREELLATLGPAGATPLHSLRVEQGDGEPKEVWSSEGVTRWEEPEMLYFARITDPRGEVGPELLVDEEEAIRWACALGWIAHEEDHDVR